MNLAIIAAMTPNRVLGYKNKLPWHIPTEFKYFKSRTIRKPIIMGRNTFESLGEPLPIRDNIVLTRNPDGINCEGIKVANNIEQALSMCPITDEVMIIGGAKIYKQFLPIATVMYISIIHKEYKGDTFFPEFSHMPWKLVKRKTFADFTTLVFEKSC